MNADIKRIQEARQSLKKLCGDFIPDVAVILGSGMSEALKDLDIQHEINFDQIPGFTAPKVEGHKGIIAFCKVGDKKVAFLRGRKHLYEGCPVQEVVLPVRTLGAMGVKHLFVTNAAGSLNPKYNPGDFMLINNHINFQAISPAIGKNEESLGPRFFDMTHPYSSAWGEVAMQQAKKLGLTLHHGVYVGVLGPNFETAAEIKMFHQWGGDAVGMSTVSEVIAARHMGIEVFGVSMITNYGAGIKDNLIDHEHVLDLAHDAGPKLAKMLINMIEERPL
ncbi:MAG TPA: purine-nucleoside phosphorylase [Oligoflexia bacterium]|nr:purine-nucleoside phosphorylase [Oligoflexia bacterium]HMR25445.1 purine-nucleoside phosphorylase [Oligoflexia bacterium]